TTETVVGIIADYLQTKGHTVIIKRMRDGVTISELTNTDLTIFATPSWLERKLDGQPHTSFLQFMDAAQNDSFSGMKYALVGLGDSTYARFCHGIDVIEEFLKQKQTEKKGETLKLDSFFFDQERQTVRLNEWLEQLSLQ